MLNLNKLKDEFDKLGIITSNLNMSVYDVVKNFKDSNEGFAVIYQDIPMIIATNHKIRTLGESYLGSIKSLRLIEPDIKLYSSYNNEIEVEFKLVATDYKDIKVNDSIILIAFRKKEYLEKTFVQFSEIYFNSLYTSKDYLKAHINDGVTGIDVNTILTSNIIDNRSSIGYVDTRSTMSDAGYDTRCSPGNSSEIEFIEGLLLNEDTLLANTKPTQPLFLI